MNQKTDKASETKKDSVLPDQLIQDAIPRSGMIRTILGSLTGLLSKTYFDKFKHNAITVLITQQNKHNEEIEELKKEYDREIKTLKEDHIETLEKKKAEWTDKLFRMLNKINYKHTDIGRTRDPNPVLHQEFMNFDDSEAAEFLRWMKKSKIKLNRRQRKVLFCKHTAVNVLAGAGAGKSTTLCCRVLFLNQVVHIPLEKISVMTFTNESKLDFIDKLKELYLKRNPAMPLDEEVARSIVRTFHSVAYEVNRQISQGSRQSLFPDGMPTIDPEDQYGSDIENPMAMEKGQKKRKTDNDSSLSYQLNVAYKKLYGKSDKFRGYITSLHIASLRNCKNPPSEYKDYKYVGFYENQLIPMFNQWWKDNLEVRYDEIISKYGKAVRKEIDGVGIQFQLFLPNLNANVSLGAPGEDFGGMFFDEKMKQKVSPIIFNRAKLLWLKAPESFVYVDNIRDLNRLIRLEELESEALNNMQINHPFDYTCAGDLPAKEPVPIFAKFKEYSDFLYSLGKRLADLPEHQVSTLFKECTPNDIVFMKAAREFQEFFEEYCEEANSVTFERIFYELRNIDTEVAMKLRKENFRLDKISHLLIDEFQDISKNIIDFITTLKQLNTMNDTAREKQISEIMEFRENTGSLMCVGDEKQAIYSWRGSSPCFINHFNLFFPGTDKFRKLSIIENYRSHRKILQAADKCLVGLTACKSRDYLAKGEANSSTDSEFKIYRQIDDPNAGDNSNKTSINYEQLVAAVDNEIELARKTGNLPVLLLTKSRRLVNESGNDLFNSRLAEWKKVDEYGHSDVKVLTIHASKGLESSTVFIIGDIAPPDSHPIKDACYAYSGIRKLEKTYKRAQNDEAIRLCYVAITRAKKRCFWFLNRTGTDSVSRYYDQKFYA